MNVTRISSRGLLYSCDHHSKSPISSSIDVNHLTGDLSGTIYVCTESLQYFIETCLPRIKKPFVLVSGDSDITVEPSYPVYAPLFASPYFRAWYGQNMIYPIEKCFQLPIGLDYHTVWANPNHKWLLPGESSLPSDQEAQILSIPQSSDRLCKIYVNFGALDKYGDRRAALATIPQNLMTLHLKHVPRSLVWKFMAKHAFVLSPFGNGLDCQRTWEALILGAIPILRGVHFKNLFEGLPVLIVNSWSDVTPELLQSTLKTFALKKWDLEKLTLDWWITRIHRSLRDS